jgi:O-antigen/teichoic acid export membrane protein
MAGYKQNTKLMAKNTAFMYIKMAVKMLVSLYTVRVILHALGAEDYGIYNVVGGFVTMFSFITSTLVSASMRFFAYSIGKGEYNLLNRYFNITIVCYLILSVLLFVVIEILGYWFVNYKMVVPDNRLSAANWVLQFAIIAFIVRMMSVPFMSLLVAFEKMIVVALIVVFDTFLLLGIAFVIQEISFDRLKFYSFCILGVALISSFLFVVLCRMSFSKESKIKLCWDGPLLKEILSYSGWYIFGTMATVLRSQGINILLNLFFNPVVNAARAIAYQINSAINQFVNSFYNAVRPQITKLTAAKEKEKMLSLVYSSSVISFLLMDLVAVPLLVEMPFVLSIWLDEVPEHTVIFARLVLITAMIDTLGYPPSTAVCAKGNIRNYQVITGVILLLNLPVSYFLLIYWLNPSIVFYVSIFFSFVTQIVRIGFMNRMFGMPLMEYMRNVIWRLALVTLLTLLISYYAAKMIDPSLFGHLFSIVLSLAVVMLLSWFLGLKKTQRKSMLIIMEQIIHRK